MTVRIEHGDMREVLARLKAEGVAVQSIVTDPPYGLAFMGRGWDAPDNIAFRAETWRLCYDLLPPGGHLLAFSGTRTYHRMACAIEDAGFEIRDMVSWIYGSGFPKSHNVGKALAEWDGWGTALKPALEPICLARKPLVGTVAANVLAHGTGALNIEACRVGTEGGGGNGLGSHFGQLGNTTPLVKHGSDLVGSTGRWPANVAHDGSDEVTKAFPDTGVSAGGRIGNKGGGNVANIPTGQFSAGDPGFGDSGSAARFFYSAKADADDRLGSKHPTVKPVDLMRWLVRLITPPGGLVLDPFAGSGATGMACMAEGLDCILVEREAEYVADIRARIAHVHGDDTPLFSRLFGPD